MSFEILLVTRMLPVLQIIVQLNEWRGLWEQTCGEILSPILHWTKHAFGLIIVVVSLVAMLAAAVMSILSLTETAQKVNNISMLTTNNPWDSKLANQLISPLSYLSNRSWTYIKKK